MTQLEKTIRAARRCDRYKQIYLALNEMLVGQRTVGYDIEWRQGSRLIFEATVRRSATRRKQWIMLIYLHQFSRWLCQNYQLSVAVNPEKISVLVSTDGRLSIIEPSKIVERIDVILIARHPFLKHLSSQHDKMVTDSLLAELHDKFCVDDHPKQLLWDPFAVIRGRGYELGIHPSA